MLPLVFIKMISKKGQNQLLKIARETLVTYLKSKKIPVLNLKNRELNQKMGVFVTLKKAGRLRGCLGEFESQLPLYQLVQKKAIDAAIKDPRFYPLEERELESIKIEISVISPLRKIDDWHKIKLGEHGVWLKQGWRGGTFLPQVARETGWSLEEFLSHLCTDKAGLNPNCFKDPQTEIFVYTAQIFSEE